MTVMNSMESYAARLASFNSAHPFTKKRNSDTKGTKSLKWPHKTPSPPQLARAGFFYRPTSSRPDNTICYLCESQLDGWEDEDDAVVEHLKHSPNCGWAIIVAIEQDIESGSYSLEDPMSEKVLNARRMTFGSLWPHENKRGWTCKTQKMIEAGWHYCPTLESDDYVRCSYCNLGLDGWEPKDKPFDEHQRRSPDCSFFTLYASIKSNPGRSKKSRGSKASRLSTQSNFTSVSEGPSAVDLDPDNDETMMSAAEAPPTKSVKGKKGAKSGRGSMKTKAKSSRIRQEESQITSSFIEPEDDDFEVKIAASPAPITNSKKRKSDEISLGNNDESVLQPKTKDPQSQLPSKRQRRTRASSSVTQTRTEPPPSLPQESEVSGPMTDAEEMPPPPGFASKKKGRGGRKRASSTARKASSASIASKASLRANVPDDEDIEAALEAELDRPLTDEEGDLEPVEIEKPKTRRLTRSKPGAKKGMASVAPTRRGTRASSVTVAEPSMAVHYPSLENGADDNLEVENGSAEQLAPDVAPVDSSSEEKLKKDKRSRKPPLEQSDPEHHFEEAKEAIISTNQEKTQDASQATRPQRPKGRKASRQISAHATQSSNMMTHNDGVDHVSDIGSSIIDTQTARDDSGHETDASVIKQTRPKRGAKKAPTVAKKGKGRKKAAPTNEDSVAALQMEKKDTQADKDDEKMLNVTANHAEGAETNASAIEPPEEKTEEIEAKISRKSEDKAGKDKTAIRDMSNAASPGRIDAAVELQDTPISLPAPSMHSTPRPVLSSQSSDAENQPPSSRPSALRPPLAIQSPSKSQIIRVPLAITPTASPSRGNFSKLQSAIPWTAVDLEHVFQGTPTAEKENNPFTIHNLHGGAKNILTSPEKKLTVEEWIHFNAQRGEEKLRNECERLVGNFEKEGVRALRTLEGIECSH